MIANDFIQNPNLPGDDFFWQGNQTGILLIHGFTATTAEIRPLAERLHEAGFTTAGPLLPGHGTHPDHLNNTTWQQWLEKADQTYQQLAAVCNSVTVIGESMGALLAIELAVKHPRTAGLILCAPAIKINGLWQVRLLAPFKSYLVKKGKKDNLPWKGYTVYPLKGAAEMHKLQQQARKHLSMITQPTLVFTGEYDRTIAADAADIILGNIQSSRKEHVHLKESGHVIVLDRNLDQVFEHVLGMIDQNQEERQP